MRTLSIKSAKLSDSGKKKFDNLFNIAKMRLGASIENDTVELKKKVAGFAPDEAEEEFTLSYPSLPKDNFFKKEGHFQFMYLKEAIKAEQIDIRSYDDGMLIKSYLGHIERLSSQIGFCWYHGPKGSATLRSTLDGGAAWKRLLELWEVGGTFTVTARDPGDLLTFYSVDAGERITVESQEKYIPLTTMPRTMYQAGSHFYQNTFEQHTKAALKASIASAGFITT